MNELLRIVACASADGGGSTLLGRLIAEASATAKRRFIVADAASTADVALLAVDARTGITAQARRRAHVFRLLGVGEVILAIDKMDLVDDPRGAYERILRELPAGARAAPVAAMPWYSGPTLLSLLEGSQPRRDAIGSFRMVVQGVDRPSADLRGYSGTVVRGAVKPGDRIAVLPAGTRATVDRIVTTDGDLGIAVANQSITLTLREDVDASPGDVLADASDPAPVANQFEATVAWMGEEPLLPGRDYLMKIGARTVTATVAPLRYRIDTDTLEHMAAHRLERDEIGVCQLELSSAIAYESCAAQRDLGSFTLIDRVSSATVAAGMLNFALHRAENLRRQALDIDRDARAAAKQQRPCVVWFTGLPGAGKSTIANLVDKRLHALKRHTFLLDGDNLRHGLNKDLGFTPEARVENIRRAAEVARLMADAGLIVLAAFISPFRSERLMARSLLPPGEFIEVFVDAPLAVAESRDPKGLYAKARRGLLRNFTGIDSPYEPPENPEFVIDTTRSSAEDAARTIVEALLARGH